MVLVHVDLWAYILGARGKLGAQGGRAGRGRKGQERDGAMVQDEGGKGKMDAGTQWAQERERRQGEGERK
jgi:hypothetical protein